MRAGNEIFQISLLSLIYGVFPFSCLQIMQKQGAQVNIYFKKELNNEPKHGHPINCSSANMVQKSPNELKQIKLIKK